MYDSDVHANEWKEEFVRQSRRVMDVRGAAANLSTPSIHPFLSSSLFLLIPNMTFDIGTNPSPKCSPTLDKSWNSQRKLQKITDLCEELSQKFPQYGKNPNQIFQMSQLWRPELMQLLRQMLDITLSGVKEDPTFTVYFVNRSDWKNVTFHPDVGLSLVQQPKMLRSSGKRVERLVQVLILVLRALDAGQLSMKRDLLYMDQSSSKQCQLDEVVDDIAAHFRISRVCLNTISSSVGLVFGDLSFETQLGDYFNCLNKSAAPTSILSNGTQIVRMKSSASFVLVIEKDTTFRRLVMDKVATDLNCILVTGKGYPDVPTRMFVSLLWKFLRIPILGLFDGDPNGFEIMCVYRFGTLTMAYDSEQLACPQMRWIGFFPGDFELSELRGNRPRQWLSHKDVKKLDDLMARPYVTQCPELMHQLVTMGSRGEKRGLEEFSDVRGNYLSANFLPQRIRNGPFL